MDSLKRINLPLKLNYIFKWKIEKIETKVKVKGSLALCTTIVVYVIKVQTFIFTLRAVANILHDFLHLDESV